MKYELILKIKDHRSANFQQAGKIIVKPEHLKAQEEAYKTKAEKMDIYDYVILINELDDNNEFIRVVI